MSVCSCCSVRTTCLVLGVLAILVSVSRELLKTYKGIAVRNEYRDIDADGDLLSFLRKMGELMDMLEHVLCIREAFEKNVKKVPKSKVKQDLVFSVKLHLVLIP